MVKNNKPALERVRVVCFKWYLQESNQGHTDFQSVALPTELRYHAYSAGANIALFSLSQSINLKKMGDNRGFNLIEH